MSATVLQAPPRAAASGLGPLIRSLVINILGPYLLYRAVEGHFPAKSTAPLLISALIPLIEFAVVYARKRTIDVIAIISLVQLAASLIITLFTHSVDTVMTGNALQPAALGLVFGGSLLIGRPLIIPLARLTMAGDDPVRQTRFDAIAALPRVRRGFGLITLVWTVAPCLHTVILLFALRMMAAHDYLLFSNMLAVVFNGLLVWGSIRYGRAIGREANPGKV